MSELERVITDLVIANRILAREDVVDAYGHVSIRHPRDPERYLLSVSRSPELVTSADIVEYTLAGKQVKEDDRAAYLERFIHGAIYEARPDVQAVVHSHAEDVLPFGIVKTKLRPVIHSGSVLGGEVPVWDIRANFGDTNLLVRNMEQGRDLAKGLGQSRAVLMRGHGFAAGGSSLIDAVRLAVYMPRNARVQQAALRLAGDGEIIALSPGELAARLQVMTPHSAEMWRAWEYWASRAGCGQMLGERPDKATT